MLRWLRKLHLRNSAICSRNFGRREIEARVREVQDTWRPSLDDTELLRTTVYQKHSSMQRSNSMYIEWPLTNVRLLWVASDCLSPEVPINVGCNYNDQPCVPTPVHDTLAYGWLRRMTSKSSLDGFAQGRCKIWLYAGTLAKTRSFQLQGCPWQLAFRRGNYLDLDHLPPHEDVEWR